MRSLYIFLIVFGFPAFLVLDIIFWSWVWHNPWGWVAILEIPYFPILILLVGREEEKPENYRTYGGDVYCKYGDPWERF